MIGLIKVEVRVREDHETVTLTRGKPCQQPQEICSSF